MASYPKRSTPSPAPKMGKGKILPTPNIDDLIFYENVDSRLKNYNCPSYGDIYKGARGDYTNHVLIFVSNDEGDGWVKHFYAADREHQGAYNLEYQNPEGSSGGFPHYTRTYLVRRSEMAEWVSSPNGNVVDPTSDKSVEGNHISPASPDPDAHFNPEFKGFVFTSEQVADAPMKELRSMFVTVIRKFEYLGERRSFILNPISGKLDPVLTKIVLKADAAIADLDPSTGEYTVVDDLNEEWTRQVTKFDPQFSAKDVELSGGTYSPELCELITETNKIVPAGTLPKTPDDNGYYTVVTPINKYISRETTKVDKNTALKNTPFSSKKFFSGLDEIYTLDEKIVDKGSAVATSPSEASKGQYTYTQPISPCLTKEVDTVDQNWSILNKEFPVVSYDPFNCSLLDSFSKVILSSTKDSYKHIPTKIEPYSYRVSPVTATLSKAEKVYDSKWSAVDKTLSKKVYNSGTCAIESLDETIVVGSGTASPASDATGKFTEVVPINHCLSKEVERVDPNWSLLDQEFSSINYIPSTCAYTDLGSKIVLTSTLDSYKTKPTKVDPTYWESSPINAKLSRLVKKVDANWAMHSVELKAMVYNPQDGKVYPVKTTIVDMVDVPETTTDVSASGNITTYTPISSCLARKEEKTVRGDLDDTYYTTMRYSIPAEFSHFETEIWGRRDGGERISLIPVYNSYPISGTFKCKVEQTWTITEPTNVGDGIVNFRPTPIIHQLTGLGCSASVPPCIHGDVRVTASNGTADPIWSYNTYDKTTPATDPATIPSSFVVQDSVTPSAGGYMRRKVTLYTT